MTRCEFSSANCWFAHPDDPEWDTCWTRRKGGKVPKGPAADMGRYGSRRSGAWSRSRSRSRERSWSRERERDKGWGERGRQYPSRSRSPPRRPDSLASSHASAVHGPTSPRHPLREPHRASIKYHAEINRSPLTSVPPFAVQSSPALSLPPPSPARPPPVPQPPPPTPGSPVQLFSPFQRIRPEVVTTLERTATANSSPTTAVSTLKVPPQPPAVAASTTATELTDVRLAPPTEHSSLSPAIPGLTSSTKQRPVQEKMSVTSLEEGQVAEISPPLEELGTRAALPSALSPMPPLLPVPTLPSFEHESTPVTEISQEVKIDTWNKRIQWVFSRRLLFFKSDC
jgi:hypothetical protein